MYLLRCFLFIWVSGTIFVLSYIYCNKAFINILKKIVKCKRKCQLAGDLNRLGYMNYLGAKLRGWTGKLWHKPSSKDSRF